MVAMQIRDVPDDVRRVLGDRATERGQSLQAYLLRLVTDDARKVANLAALQRFEGREDGSRLMAGDSARVLDEVRAERDDQLCAGA